MTARSRRRRHHGQLGLFEREELDRGHRAASPAAGRPAPVPRPGAAPLACRVLGSGSRGNATVLRCGEQWVLVDAGFSCRELERRLRWIDVEPSAIVHIVLTHEHGDHCRGAVNFARRYDLPVAGTKGTLEHSSLRRLARPRFFEPGVPFTIGALQVLPFRVLHDAREPVGLVFEDRSGFRVGLVADLGRWTRSALGALHDLDVLLVESNHDEDMLFRGPYPYALKQRVAGDRGHLCNREAARGVERLLCDRLRTVVLYHLSETNNRPALAAAEMTERLDRRGSTARVMISSQSEPSTWIETAVPSIP